VLCGGVLKSSHSLTHCVHGLEMPTQALINSCIRLSRHACATHGMSALDWWMYA